MKMMNEELPDYPLEPIVEPEIFEDEEENEEDDDLEDIDFDEDNTED